MEVVGNRREMRRSKLGARSVRFPALALSRSGSKGISHPRNADLQLRATQDPRVSSAHDTPPARYLATCVDLMSGRAARLTVDQQSAYSLKSSVASGELLRSHPTPEKNRKGLS